MKKLTTADRLSAILSERNLKQVELLEMAKSLGGKYGVKFNKADISQYVSGKVEPGQDKLSILGMALGVSEAWLMGYDVPKSRESYSEQIKEKGENSIPLLGRIAAGTPILAEQNIEDYFSIDKSIKCDFCLRVQGDSMLDEGILDNDIVFIRKQSTVESGEIAAVVVDGEATLKRIFLKNGTIILQPANKNYEPIILTDGDVRIAGKLAAVLNVRN